MQHEELTSSFSQELVAEWDAQILKWEADPDSADPYEDESQRKIAGTSRATR